MTKIKICGTTNLADARYASGAGADFLGFVQHEASPRFVTPEMAKDIISWVYGAKPVGVFVDKPADEVNTVCDFAGFEFVQLHGSETPAYCEWIDRPIIKAIRVTATTTREDLSREMDLFTGVSEYFLLDTSSQEGFGGTGNVFDWNILSGFEAPLPFFLAGGLSPLNIADALARSSPFAVDVASGVEEEPGIKDFAKIDAFIAAIQKTQNP